MKLNGMAEAYQEQALNKDFQKMSFENLFSLLVVLEHSRWKSNRLQRLIKAATFINATASIEDIEYHEDHRLDKALFLKLANGAYIQNSHNIILKGPTGSGKKFLTSAFGVSACRQFHKVKYIRLHELIDELSLAKPTTNGSYRKGHQKIHESRCADPG